jgi:hypothetical protein
VRKALVLCAVVLALLALALPAYANGKGAQTETTRFHKVTDTFVDVVPCTGEQATFTVVQNGVVHTTALANGTFHITGTMTGKFTAVTEDGTTYTGRFTVWFGGNSNRNNEANTFTFTLHATAEDGTTIKAHQVGHFSSSASEPPKLTEFFKENCGN